MSEKKTQTALTVSEQERKLLDLIRQVEYGEFHLFIRDGVPVRAEQVLKSIRLD